MTNPYTRSSPLVVQIANAYGLRADLLAAQIEAESGGDAWAFRHEPAYFDHYIRHKPAALGYRFGPLAACSYGLLQVLLETALEYGFTDRPEQLFVPRVGLTFGAKYLQHCLMITGNDYRQALAKFNGSGSRADAYSTRVFAICDRQGNG